LKLNGQQKRQERQKEAREAQEAKERELARVKEEEAKLAQGRELEKSLVAKKTGESKERFLKANCSKTSTSTMTNMRFVERMRESLKKMGPFEKNPKMKIQIEGHCDERGTGRVQLALGERRANSTKRYLVSLGILRIVSLRSVMGGEAIGPRNNEEAWAKNRRAHIVVLSK